ncbi:MAG: hypothetical protein ACHQXA_09265, partial [Gemmatimonadales bacterium]
TAFTLTGRKIDLRLTKSQLSGVRATGQSHAVNPDWDLVADTIDLALAHQQLAQTLAWGDSIRPHAIAPDREIKADSLAIDTPDQRLKEARAFGTAWVGSAPDTVTHERDQLWGDTVVAEFTSRDSAGKKLSSLQRVEARSHARSYHVLSGNVECGRAAVSYVRGDRIVLRFRAGVSNDVERVEVHGKVDGVQIEPKCPPADSTRADSAKGDTTRTGKTR